nr:retrotransposon protein, putative, Ty1-copia subclass [Tanacetum cinerariifolium]
KRDYSNARTSQQNGVSEKKNRTLIEAPRTMLADSLLPTIFWTEAVATACYVLNRIVETMNIKFLENLPSLEGTGQPWLFDIDYLTDSLNYARIRNTNLSAGNQEKKLASSKTPIPAGRSVSADKPIPAGRSVFADKSIPAVRKKAKAKFPTQNAFVSYIQDQRRNNNTDFQLCLFFCFLSKMEPTSVAQALLDPDWVEAMQEELQQFQNQRVWVLVELPEGKHAIGTKWILKNKRDARGIVCRNKA